VSDDAEKLHIVYYPRGSFTHQFYTVSAPYRWEDMTPKERAKWAKAALKRKNSTWRYVQINGYKY